MESIIKDLENAKIKLDALIKSAEERDASLLLKQAKLDVAEFELKERASAISVREAEVAKFGGIEAGSAYIAKANAELTIAQNALAEEKAKIDGKIAELEAKQAEVDNLMRIYLANDKNNQIEKARLEAKEKNMREEILEQLRGLK